MRMAKTCLQFECKIQPMLSSLFQKFRDWKYSAPLTLLGVTLVAYGLFAAQQGFHWDDWGFVWMMRFGGPERLLEYFSVARPVMARLYLVTLPLLGPNPFAWQIFALFWRATAAIACWWALRQVFISAPAGGSARNSTTETATEQAIFWVALLTLVYPGFSQHSIAIAYGHYSLYFTAFWLSLGLMMVALRADKRKWLPLSSALILSAWSLFSAEYAFGLELLRPVFLWLALQGGFSTLKQKAISTLRAYLPYLVVLIAFVIWRVFIFGFRMYDAELLNAAENGGSGGFASLPGMAAEALLNTSLRAWINLLDFSALADFSTRLFVITVAIIIASFLFLLNFAQDKEQPTTNQQPPTTNWILLGLLGLLAAGIPFYVAGLPVTLTFPNDRFTISFAFASASLLVGLAGLIRRPEVRSVALSLLVALSIGKQIQFADSFRQDWDEQKSFFWQLAWRAPMIEPNTALVSDDSGIKLSVDYSLSAPLNWIYNPSNPQGRMDYGFFFLGTRLHGEIPALEKDQPIANAAGVGVFRGSTNDMLVYQFRPPSCLHVLDPLYNSEIPAPPNSVDITKDMLADGIPVLTARTLQALPLSDVSRIVDNGKAGAAPPPFLFGTEPAHTWCYYYQKADLARQQSDWDKVAELGDQAFAIPYLPNDASEFLPFIEAYLRLGRIDDAREWTRAANKQMPIIAPALCAVWQRVESDGINIPESAMEKTLKELKYCPAQ